MERSSLREEETSSGLPDKAKGADVVLGIVICLSSLGCTVIIRCTSHAPSPFRVLDVDGSSGTSQIGFTYAVYAVRSSIFSRSMMLFHRL